MNFAISLSKGGLYEAYRISYAQAKALKLICPVCKEKVFKRVRTIPHETHMFVHHKGGAPDCELYYPSVNVRKDGNRCSAPIRGQTFDQFIADVDKDFGRLLVASNLVPGGAADDKLLRLIYAIVTRRQGEIRPDFELIQSNAKAFLFDFNRNQKAKELVPEIFEYYEKSRARFIDGLFCKWFLYSIFLRATTVDLPAILAVLSKDRDLFSKLAGIALSGLILFYANEDLDLFSNRFNALVEGYIYAKLKVRSENKVALKRADETSTEMKKLSRSLSRRNMAESGGGSGVFQIGVTHTDFDKLDDRRYAVTRKMPNCKYCGAQTDAPISHLFTCRHCGKTNFID